MKSSHDPKSKLRAALKARLTAIPPQQRKDRSIQAANLLIAQEEYRRSAVVLVFLSLPDEIDTTPLIEQAWRDARQVLAPRIDWGQRRLIPTPLRSLSTGVVQTRWNLREPAPADPFPLDGIDLVVVPGLGFDLTGYRLGRGGGLYDAFLALPDLHARTCGLAFDEQVVDSLPTEAHDVRLEMLVTDRRIIRS